MARAHGLSYRRGHEVQLLQGSTEFFPALIAGNAIVFKPSEKTPATGAMLVDLYHRAGVPEGVVRVLIGGPLSNNKGINLPGIHVSAPSMPEKDLADLIVGQQFGGGRHHSPPFPFGALVALSAASALSC